MHGLYLKYQLCIVEGDPEIFPICPDVDSMC